MVHCIHGKAILANTGKEIQDAAGVLHICAGQQVGCEAAIHSMRKMFIDPDAEVVLLVDASNAFNT